MIFDLDPTSGEDGADEFAEFHDLLFGSLPTPTEQESLAMLDETLSSADIDDLGLSEFDHPLHGTEDHLTTDHQDADLDYLDDVDGSDRPDSFDSSDGLDISDRSDSYFGFDGLGAEDPEVPADPLDDFGGHG